MLSLPGRVYNLLNTIARFSSQTYCQVWINARTVDRFTRILSFGCWSQSYIEMRTNTSSPTFSVLAWSGSHVDKITLDRASFGLTCPLPSVHIISVELCICMINQFLRRLQWIILSARAISDSCWRTLRDQSESKDIFLWINESKGGIFPILYDLQFKSLTFQVDQPAHFVLFASIKTLVPSSGGDFISYKHSHLRRVYFQAQRDICLSYREFLPDRSTLSSQLLYPPWAEGPTARLPFLAFPYTQRTARTAAVQRFVSNLPINKITFIVISKVYHYLMEIVQGQSCEDLELFLRIIRDMTEYWQCYETNFFIDSISIFFSSLGLIIICRITNINSCLSQQTLQDMSQSPKYKDHIQVSNDQIEVPMRNPREAKSMAQQNRLLKKQNQLLRRQLQNFSIKLDLEIRKKAQEYIHKPWSKQEDVAHKQLQNAYKQCEIYRRQASFYRKRVDAISEQQGNHQSEWKAKQLEKQNKQMIDEIASLKKIIKIQEKGLTELGTQGYLNLVAQKQKLQEEVRILNKQIDLNRRNQRSNSQSIPKISNSKIHQTIVKAKNDEEQTTKRRFQTQPSVKSVKEKEDKDGLKIKIISAERDKLRHQVGYYKEQLDQKNREIQTLKIRIQNLRKNNNLLQSQLNIKKSFVEEPDSMANDENSKSRVTSKPRKWTQSTPVSKNAQRVQSLQKKEAPNQSLQLSNSFKWSHQAFTSKMLQIQLLIHQKGHIQDIHVRYEKGQPKRYSTAKKNTFVSLVCRQGEYIKHISGCFFQGYLQCLSLTTSDKRTEIFGNTKYLQINQLCDRFEFSVEKGELPGALYGENDEQGIRKLGCVILKQ